MMVTNSGSNQQQQQQSAAAPILQAEAVASLSKILDEKKQQLHYRHHQQQHLQQHPRKLRPMSSASLTEANSSYTSDYDDDADDDAELDVLDEEAAAASSEQQHIRSLIDLALTISLEDYNYNDEEEDDDYESLLLLGEEDDSASLASYDDRTVDSLILTRQRLPSHRQDDDAFASSGKDDGKIPRMDLQSLQQEEDNLVRFLEQAQQQQQKEDSPPENDSKTDAPPPPSLSLPLLPKYELDSTPPSRFGRRTIVKPTDSMEKLARPQIPAFQHRQRIKNDVLVEKRAREAPLPELVRVDTDELLQYKQDLLEEDFDDDDSSFCSLESALLRRIELGEDGCSSDFEPFDDEIDSIVVNKQRLAKHERDCKDSIPDEDPSANANTNYMTYFSNSGGVNCAARDDTGDVPH